MKNDNIIQIKVMRLQLELQKSIHFYQMKKRTCIK